MKACTAAAAILSLLGMLAGCGKPQGQAVLPEQNTDFNQLFATNCSGCHGTDGKQGAAPRLNDPLFLAFIDRESLHDVIANGRQGTPMPAFAKTSGGFLTAEQIDALVNGMESRWARPVNLKGQVMPG